MVSEDRSVRVEKKGMAISIRFVRPKNFHFILIILITSQNNFYQNFDHNCHSIAQRFYDPNGKSIIIYFP